MAAVAGQNSRLKTLDVEPSEPLAVLSHEQFCQARAHGANQADAARIAGFNSQKLYDTAKWLERRADIAARIAWLNLHGVGPPGGDPAEVVVDKAWLMKKGVLAVLMSEERGDRNSLIKALTFLANLSGEMVHKTEVRAGPLDDLPSQDLVALVSLARQRQAAIAGPRDADLTVEASETEAPPQRRGPGRPRKNAEPEIRIIDVDGE